jgi:hypothetical protein
MKNLTVYAIIIFAILTSCSHNKQQKSYPYWWKLSVENEISSFGSSIHSDEKTARFGAQNQAYQKFSGQIGNYLNKYVAENCIAPGDEVIQKEIDKVFTHFISYFKNIEKPEISIGESESVQIKINKKKNIEYFVRLYVEAQYVHTKFVEFLETSDLYMNPKLRDVLKECFKE